MKILYEIPENKIFNNPVVTIGTFDGVHAGHREIFAALLKIAGEKSGDAVVLTFESHPRKIINPATPPRILTTKQEKIRAIKECGIDNIIVLNFTREIADMNPVDFLDEIIIKKIGLQHLVIGYDHAFGKDRKGDYAFLSEIAERQHFGVTRVDPLDYHSTPVSSTWIRTEIEDGNIAFANSLLGRKYSLFGKVVKGNQIGSKIGFPTANIVPEDPDKIIPKDGVYAVSVVLQGGIKKGGMINIGTNPTFSNTERSIEVNIFDFNEDIYDKTLEVDFYDRIRDEVKFESPEALVEQLKNDKLAAKELMKNNGY
ncbi:MAG: bifunctional riboflavin kinase/FAD synthetase [Spirochaetes bacterium]|nr:bifunctional riboflavin kinase/FAD synthetase [Spirochaetota bacterium]